MHDDSKPEGLFHICCLKGINDQYAHPGGRMAQLNAEGGGGRGPAASGRGTGVPFIYYPSNDFVTCRTHAEGRDFSSLKTCKLVTQCTANMPSHVSEVPVPQPRIFAKLSLKYIPVL